MCIRDRTQDNTYDAAEREAFLLPHLGGDEAVYGRIHDFARSNAYAETEKSTYQAMEALIHNLNTCLLYTSYSTTRGFMSR